MSRLFLPFKAVFPVFSILAIVLLAALPAWAQVEGLEGAERSAQTLGSMTNNLYHSTLQIQTFLSLLSYILGIYFSITGLLGLRDHIEDPGRNPLNKAVLRLAAAAFFIFAPTFANLLVNSLGGGTVGSIADLQFQNRGDPSISAKGQGLEAVLNRLVSDIAGPLLDNMIPFVAYVAGVIFMMIGLKRLALANGDGPQAPGGMGTIGTFIVAAGLMSFGYIVATLEGSLFGPTEILSNPLIKGDGKSDLINHANQAMWGVFIFLRIVGYISVLRALFMLRAAGEGGQVSMMVVGTHMIAGALLINATGFVMMIQETFIDNRANYILE